MLRIAICDDCTKHINMIKSAAENYVAQRIEQDVQISEFDNALLFLEALTKNGAFDILMLDICMPGILGTDVAREIRYRRDNTEIIFITTSDEFAVEAFALKAAHYLIKPFTQPEFDEAMDRAVERFAAKQSKPITLKLRSGNVKIIDLNDIIFVESCSHSQNIHLKSGECIEARQSLAELMSLMEKASTGQFVTPYKGYIVNLKSIRTIETEQIVLHSGQSVPVAKRSFRELQERYFDYTFQRGEH